MDVETLGDWFTRDRRTDRPVLEDGEGRVYDAHWLCTSAWKAGNYLAHTGVRQGATVGVVGDGPLAVLAFYGTACLGGATWFDPPAHDPSTDSIRTLVAPTDAVAAYDLPPGGQRVGYGAAPAEPTVRHFEADLWSENPSFPPQSIDPDTTLVTTGKGGFAEGDGFAVGDGSTGEAGVGNEAETGPSDGLDAPGGYSNRECLQAARSLVDEVGIDRGDRVALAAPLADPRAVVGALVAPLIAGGVLALGSHPEPVDFVVGSASTGLTDADARRIDPASVALD